MGSNFLFLILFTLGASPLEEVSSAKILTISFISTKSHFITYEPLLNALAERGHEITIANAVQGTKSVKNVRRVFTFDMNKKFSSTTQDLYSAKEKEPDSPGYSAYTKNAFYDYIDYFTTACVESYKLPDVQALRQEKFDVIIFPQIGNDCIYGLIHELKAPVILWNQVAISHHVVASLGNPSLPSFVPNLYLPHLGGNMDFWNRVLNFWGVLYYDMMRKWYYFPRMEKIYREYVRQNLPGVEEIERNSSLALVNSHFNFIPPRPLTPDVIEVGGLHLRDPKPLEAEFKEFCDGAKDGVIIFTMGSILNLSAMPEKYREAFVNAFKQLKQRVIWKWETDEPLPNLPKNILQRKWLPQQDILGHNNTRLFITHGGYGSTSEALYSGIPLLGIPIMAEQQWNVEQAVSKGFAKALSFKHITEETLLKNIKELVDNPDYLKRAKFLSQLYKDHTETPLERAIYWVEYVLRYGGAPHLRSIGRDLTIVQYYSLDVITLLLGIIASFVAAIVLTLWCCYRLVYPKKKGPPASGGKKTN